MFVFTRNRCFVKIKALNCSFRTKSLLNNLHYNFSPGQSGDCSQAQRNRETRSRWQMMSMSLLIRRAQYFHPVSFGSVTPQVFTIQWPITKQSMLNRRCNWGKSNAKNNRCIIPTWCNTSGKKCNKWWLGLGVWMWVCMYVRACTCAHMWKNVRGRGNWIRVPEKQSVGKGREA